jgi:hypothetical protein
MKGNEERKRVFNIWLVTFLSALNCVNRLQIGICIFLTFWIYGLRFWHSKNNWILTHFSIYDVIPLYLTRKTLFFDEFLTWTERNELHLIKKNCCVKYSSCVCVFQIEEVLKSLWAKAKKKIGRASGKSAQSEQQQLPEGYLLPNHIEVDWIKMTQKKLQFHSD